MYSEPLLSRLLNSKRFNQLSLTLSTSKYFQNLISKQYQRQRNLGALSSLTLVFNNKPWYFVGWIQFFLIVPAPVLFIVISKLTHKTSFDPTISTFHCCFLLQDPHCPSPLYLLLLCYSSPVSSLRAESNRASPSANPCHFVEIYCTFSIQITSKVEICKSRRTLSLSS